MKNQIINQAYLKGVTLIELMIALIVAAILLGVGMPSFVEFIRNNQTVSETNKLTRDLNYARSEAVSRGETASLCRSNTGLGCTNTNWAQGWIVFSDVNGNGAFNGGAGGDAILQYNQGLDANFTLRADGGNFANAVTFRADGTVTATDTFVICRPGTNDLTLSRAIDVLATGRISISTAAGVGCP